ncbi:MAG: GxxExxY protein [bacterium]
MPIEKVFKTKHISEAEFRQIDFQLMGVAFEIQNEMGRFWNEKIYQNELAYRCQKAALHKVETEVPIKLSFKDFAKTYHVDLIINDSIIYELKVTDAFTGEHKSQVLNYLFLTGLNHGKLINLRSPLVKSEFVSTTISTEKRFDFTIEDTGWTNFSDDCRQLRQLLTDLLFEWGAFLNINLYYEAINHFRGGEQNVVQKIKVASGGRTIGKQKVHRLNHNVAFQISAILKDHHKYEEQLYKFLRFTPFKAIQWVNFNRDCITFKTLSL